MAKTLNKENQRDEYAAIKPVEFEHEGKKYRYDFKNITIEQAEMASEILEFKRMQRKKNPETFRDVRRSGGATWFQECMSYLLREVDTKGNLLPFDIDKTHITEEFIKNLPLGSNSYSELARCITDFFTLTGKKSPLLMVLQPEKHFDRETIVSQLVTNLTKPASAPAKS